MVNVVIVVGCSATAASRRDPVGIPSGCGGGNNTSGNSNTCSSSGSSSSSSLYCGSKS